MTIALVCVIALLAVACVFLVWERFRLASERDLARQRLADAQTGEAELKSVFGSLASEALTAAKQDFLQLASKTFEVDREKAKAEMEQRRVAVDQLVRPIAETLKKADEKLEKLEKERAGAYHTLLEQVKGMGEASSSLRTETSRLVQALRRPQVRGRYGEIQLQRVVELAGMRQYCDFDTQRTMRDDDGSALRPDMVVTLPNDRMIAVDAKTSIDAYLDAFEATDPDAQERALDRFAGHVLDQAKGLASKQYWDRFEHSPDFVVMFIPGDQFVDAALARRPDLMELAAQNRVVIASPSTLIGLLRAVHVGWREKDLSESADELFELGKELHDRVGKVLEYAQKVGKAIGIAGEAYNSFVGSIDSRLMPTLRRFEERGAKSGRTIPDTKSTSVVVRSIQSLPEETGAEDERGG